MAISEVPFQALERAMIRSSNEGFAPPMLTVNEIFHSIQGESTHAGRPCVFVRLTACDLRCSWCEVRKLLPLPVLTSMRSMASP